MARLTLDQIRQMTPDFGGLLQSMGLSVGGETDSGEARYVDAEGNWVSPDVVNSMMQGGELPGFQNEYLRDRGIIDASMLTDVSEVNKQAGLNLQNPDDYWRYIYGAGDRVGDYWVLPEGQRYDQYANLPPSLTHYDSADKFGALTKLVVGSIIAGGMSGMLPGTESVFGAGAGGAGAGAEGVFGGDIAGTVGAAEGAGAAAAGGGAAAAGEFAGGASGGGLAGVGEFAGGASGAGVTGATGGGALSGAGGLVASGAGTAIGRILDGTATAGDWASVLGGAGSALLGVAGANAQGDAYSDVANKYLALGAPYRNLLTQSYQPGFSMADQPDFQNALGVGAQAAARATSAKVGNPVDNPGAYADMQKWITGNLALPQLNTYRSQLGSFGGLGVNTAGTGDMNAAGQTSGAYNAIGSGIASVTRPDNQISLSDLFSGKINLNTGRFL